jgi:hypothetical protein
LKKVVFKICLVLLLLIGIAGTFWGSQIVESASVRWNSCNKVNGNCYYPGLCRDYSDSNRDSICDRSQTNPEIAAAPITSPASSNTTSTVNAGAVTDQVSSDNQKVYYLIPILLVLAVLYCVTWIFAIRKKITLAVHRKIWNTVLLVSGLVSMLLGIVLVAEIEIGFDLSLPFNSLFWHVETGIAMSLIGAFHILWHWKYFSNLFKRSN